MCELKEFSPCTHPDMKGSILSVRASAEHDPQFMMNDPSVDEIKILTGEYGQDCNQVCNARNMQCAKYMLPLVNKCSVLKRKLKCDVCIDHNLRFDSSHRNPGYNNVDKACYVSKILEKLKCEGGTHSFKRICPCANHHDNEDEKEFSSEVLKEIMPGIPNLDQDFKMIQQTIVLANLTTCERKAAFLAQVAIETADLNHFNQEHHIEMFKDRQDLGNVNPGDESKYRGRGLLQIVGRKMYEKVSEALGVDFVNKPELLADREYMPTVSAFFWTEFGMNKIADDTHVPGTIIAITHKLLAYKGDVNFQYHNRKAKWEQTKKALGCAY
jgi:predicted chitinase